jgi:hypothetical protein
VGFLPFWARFSPVFQDFNQGGNMDLDCHFGILDISQHSRFPL